MVFITHLGSLSAGIPRQSGDSKLSLQGENKDDVLSQCHQRQCLTMQSKHKKQKVAMLKGIWVSV